MSKPEMISVPVELIERIYGGMGERIWAKEREELRSLLDARKPKGWPWDDLFVNNALRILGQWERAKLFAYLAAYVARERAQAHLHAVTVTMRHGECACQYCTDARAAIAAAEKALEASK